MHFNSQLALHKQLKCGRQYIKWLEQDLPHSDQLHIERTRIIHLRMLESAAACDVLHTIARPNKKERRRKAPLSL